MSRGPAANHASATGTHKDPMAGSRRNRVTRIVPSKRIHAMRALEGLGFVHGTPFTYVMMPMYPGQDHVNWDLGHEVGRSSCPAGRRSQNCLHGSLGEQSFVLQFPIHGRFTEQRVPIRSGGFKQSLHFGGSLLFDALSAESAHLQP